MCAAAAWALGQLGRHTPDHAKAAADAGALDALARLDAAPPAGASEDLVAKARRALKSVAAKLGHLPALDALVRAPLSEGVMRVVLEQASGARVR